MMCQIIIFNILFLLRPFPQLSLNIASTLQCLRYVFTLFQFCDDKSELLDDFSPSVFNLNSAPVDLTNISFR